MCFGKVQRILKSLNGIVCLYKYPDVSLNYMQQVLRNRLCKELNESYSRPPVDYVDIVQVDESNISLSIRPSYADTVAAKGPRYGKEDIHLCFLPIGPRTSGLCIVGINDGIKYISMLKRSNPIKVLQIKGTFGKATRNFYKDGKVVAKAKYHRIDQRALDKVLCSMQSSHQRKIFLDYGVHIQSQEAYELAIQGMTRPKRNGIPSIYSMKCVLFQSPEFILELVCVNEDENYLLSFINDFGLQLRTFAYCTGIRCIQYGPFMIDDALIKQQWTIENIQDNIMHCKGKLKESKVLSYHPQLRKANENRYPVEQMNCNEAVLKEQLMDAPHLNNSLGNREY